MTYKIIQVPVDKELLKALNTTCKKQKKKRAEFVREACKKLLAQLRNEELERQYIEGYRRIPEDPIEGEIGAKLAAEVLEKEEW
jgi:metal-responsive CopG/Arc/MetJ family transcriptional regulator